MPFYKRDTNDLISSEFIEGPGFSLSEAGKDEYTYPVDGWYWFANLDAAMQNLQTVTVGTITPRQARLALLDQGLLDTVNTAVAGQPETVKVQWEYANDIRRDDPLVCGLLAALGQSPEQIDALFVLAATY